MRVIGLTGGIASGKSTVSQMLRELGAQIIDADALAREVVERGTPALLEIAKRFPGVVDSAGRLDRALLGARVFEHPTERMALNAIIHPRIHQAFVERTESLADQGVSLAIYDAALLIENKLQERLDGVILVTAPLEVQISRIISRDGIGEPQARQRVDAQLPLAEKRRFATWVVDNGGDLAQTRRQVIEIWETIRPER